MSLLCPVHLLLGVLAMPGIAEAAEKAKIVRYRGVVFREPDSTGKNSKVWTIRRDRTIRVNLVEMAGELRLHKHPDAEHSLMVLEGRVRAQVGDEFVDLEKGDYLSIPANLPHKYWSLTPKAMLVSMDAPYYDPKRTVALE